ncbi:MAG: hypothetical protein R2788_21145 [Saprospiraceae bacterium]
MVIIAALVEHDGTAFHKTLSGFLGEAPRKPGIIFTPHFLQSILVGGMLWDGPHDVDGWRSKWAEFALSHFGLTGRVMAVGIFFLEF